MKTVSIVDSLFSHADTACNGNLHFKPKHLIFDRSNKPHDIKLFTDKNLYDARMDTSPIKIAWLLESPDLYIDVYKKISSINYLKFFDYVSTHNKELLKKGPKFIFSPFGGTWIALEDWKIYSKSKNISIIASAKRDLEGHRLRHSIIESYGGQIEDILGGGYKQFENKIDGLKDYRFSIVVENCKEDYFFTEKIIDCFATGTIPIYWGCPSIANFFNVDGIIQFDNINDLKNILTNLSEELYISKMKAIEDNICIARKYAVTEDNLCINIIQEEDTELEKESIN